MNELPVTIRAFIAVRIPDEIIARLTAFQQQLKLQFGNVSWTRPAAMHVTLQFLGGIKSDELSRLNSQLNRVTRQIADFDLELSGAGSFGNRVLWVGIGAGSDSLKKLAHAVGAATSRFGAHHETKEFHSHVTLGRFRGPVRGIAAVLRKMDSPAFGRFRVQQMELIRSELSPKGSRYTTLESFVLSSG
jgi:RNA 2',3'-cyclic 3'-phosphodiesterase